MVAYVHIEFSLLPGVSKEGGGLILPTQPGPYVTEKKAVLTGLMARLYPPLDGLAITGGTFLRLPLLMYCVLSALQLALHQLLLRLNKIRHFI